MEKFELVSFEPIFETRKTIIYQHPLHIKKIIKIAKNFEPDYAWIKKFRLSRQRFGKMKDYALHYEAYIAALSQTDCLPNFLPKYYGFTDTDVGIGCVVEKICDLNGQIAPTFKQVCCSNVDLNRLLMLVDELFFALDKHSVFVGDMHTENVVVSGDMERLVVIDGLGEANLLKTKTYISSIRRRAMTKRHENFRYEIFKAMQYR